MVRTTIDGPGTGEARWRAWLDARVWPPLDLGSLAGRRIVVVAAHPDDEVLGVGGLLRKLSASGASIVAVWGSDGEASHPSSTVLTQPELATRRRAESAAALRRLDVALIRSVHLGLPDGDLGTYVDVVTAALQRLVQPGDAVLAPWRQDGHPDHEAMGAAAARLETAVLIEYPIWMWHWATPGDPRVPWEQARSVDAVDVAVKTRAVEAFRTQLRPLGPQPADAAILPPHVVERFLRPDELVFR